jgi:DNA primase
VRLQKAGVSYKGLCPFHHEKTPSFTVSEDRQVWHCFGCGKGGDIFGFLMEMEGMGFREALVLLADRSGVELKSYGAHHFQNQKNDRSMEILSIAATWYEQLLWGSEGHVAISYLRERGISDDMMRTFRLGYAPNMWDGVKKYLSEKKYAVLELEKAGLAIQKDGKSYDRFRDRIMFPITDVLGRVIGFSARVLPGADEKHAKYINTPETDVYHKSKVLYGIFQAKQNIKRRNQALVVEGNMDVIALHQAGFDNAVAVSGTALTSQHMDMLRRYTKNIALFFDMDSAGQEAAKKSTLLGFSYDMNILMVSIEGAKDAAEMAQSQPEDLLHSLQNAEPAMRYFLDRLLEKYDRNSASGRKTIALEALAFIAAFHNTVERETWMQTLAGDIGVTAQALYSVLADRKEKSLRNAPEHSELAQDPANRVFRSKLDSIAEKLMGLCLAYPLAWSSVTELLHSEEYEKEYMYMKTHALFREMVDKGLNAEYMFEKFRLLISRDSVSHFAQKLYHESRFSEDNPEFFSDIGDDDVLCRSRQLVEEIQKELKKLQISQVIRDMKKAESDRDMQAVKVLSEAFYRLSKEIKL